jgi:hypothetical protein
MQRKNEAITRRNLLLSGTSAVGAASFSPHSYGAEVEVEPQALRAQIRRVMEAAEYLGAPFRSEDLSRLQAAMGRSAGRETVIAIQETLSPYVLLNVAINPESRVTVTKGPAAPELMQGGWRIFLVRVVMKQS